jgi:hypothetical protein
LFLNPSQLRMEQRPLNIARSVQLRDFHAVSQSQSALSENSLKTSVLTTVLNSEISAQMRQTHCKRLSRRVCGDLLTSDFYEHAQFYGSPNIGSWRNVALATDILTKSRDSDRSTGDKDRRSSTPIRLIDLWVRTHTVTIWMKKTSVRHNDFENHNKGRSPFDNKTLVRRE